MFIQLTCPKGSFLILFGGSLRIGSTASESYALRLKFLLILPSLHKATLFKAYIKIRKDDK